MSELIWLGIVLVVYCAGAGFMYGFTRADYDDVDGSRLLIALSWPASMIWKPMEILGNWVHKKIT